MVIESFVSMRVVKELLSKAMPEIKYINKDMINNVRILAREEKVELDNTDIVIDTKHFDISLITKYRDTSDNYTEDKYIIVILFDLFS